MSRIYLGKMYVFHKVVQLMVIPVYTTILGPIILFRLDGKVIIKKKGGGVRLVQNFSLFGVLFCQLSQNISKMK